ncbi:MAG: hypothetical protein V7K97_08705 [Nostoc sp.]|uniref:hypothetical protein n=1 Tax=Nostoc sp. TaxID=1180 RepID=UPI002FFA9123
MESGWEDELRALLLNEHSEDDIRQQVLEDPQAWRSALGRSLTPQGLIIPVVPQYRTFPWVAVAGRRIFTQLETVFSDRYFMASSELKWYVYLRRAVLVAH